MNIEETKKTIQEGWDELEKGRQEFNEAHKKGGGKDALNPAYQKICKSIQKIVGAIQEYGNQTIQKP